jgi:hypothetical protein
MTVTTECSPLAEVAGQESLTALMSRRDADGEPGIERPVLAAALPGHH